MARRFCWAASGALAVALLAAACSASPATTPSPPGGCADRLPELLTATGASLSGSADRADLRAAWEVLAARFADRGVLDLCTNDPEVGLPITPDEAIPNGAVVRIRPVVPSPFDPEDSIAAQVIYVTETARGVRAHAMTLMAIRAQSVLGGEEPDQVVYAHGTAGINVECDQAVDAVSSASFFPELRTTEALAVPEMATALLQAGKVVQAPYYLGIGPRWSGAASPYLSRETTGRTVIDAVRAVGALVATDRWGVFGHSQGGHAALAAAELAPTYGAGTELVGAVGMAPPLDIEGTLDYWLDALADPSGNDPRPDDAALPPDSPSVMTLGAHLFWGLATDVDGMPDTAVTFNRFFRYNTRESVLLNRLDGLTPIGASFHNSGDPIAWNGVWNMYTSGPSAAPNAGQVRLMTPPKATLIHAFEDLDWDHGVWSIPKTDRAVIGCGWSTNGAPGGVLYQYAVSYGGGFMNYPPGTWQAGLPMVFTSAYADPQSEAWDGVRAILREQSLIEHPIAAPVLVTSGDQDPLVPTGPTGTTEPHTVRANVAAMCAHGSDVQLLHDAAASHGGAFTAFVDEATAWLGDRFAGIPVDEQAVCTGL